MAADKRAKTPSTATCTSLMARGVDSFALSLFTNELLRRWLRHDPRTPDQIAKSVRSASPAQIAWPNCPLSMPASPSGPPDAHLLSRCLLLPIAAASVRLLVFEVCLHLATYLGRKVLRTATMHQGVACLHSMQCYYAREFCSNTSSPAELEFPPGWRNGS